MEANRTFLTVKEMTYIAIFTAIMVVTAFIQIPLPFTPVPITLQTMTVMLAGLILKPKEAALSLVVYVLLGAIGLPVFAGSQGGFSVIVGPTGGYLVSWIPAAWLVSVICGKSYHVVRASLAAFVGGIVLVYAVGVPWLALSTGMDISKAIAVGAVPFIAGDVFKLVIAILIATALRKRLKY